jgi:transposase
MKGVELYAQVRYAVQIDGLSRREAARRYGIDPRTVAKMLAFSVPPGGDRRSRPPARPKLDPFTGIIDQILMEDEGRPRKQRHTSKRIFERLRDEHGCSGGITIVKDYVLSRRIRPTAAAASINFTVATAHTGCRIPSVSIAFNASVSDRPR